MKSLDSIKTFFDIRSSKRIILITKLDATTWTNLKGWVPQVLIPRLSKQIGVTAYWTNVMVVSHYKPSSSLIISFQ